MNRLKVRGPWLYKTFHGDFAGHYYYADKSRCQKVDACSNEMERVLSWMGVLNKKDRHDIKRLRFWLSENPKGEFLCEKHGSVYHVNNRLKSPRLVDVGRCYIGDIFVHAGLDEKRWIGKTLDIEVEIEIVRESGGYKC